MNNIKEALLNSPYWAKILERDDIIAVFLTGSNCVGVADERSDYDITVLTLNSAYCDNSNYIYLTYKGRKLHWYYFPIEDLFKIDYNELKILFPIQLRNITDDFIIYENSLYKSLLHRLLSLKYDISRLVSIKFIDNKLNYINTILNSGYISEDNYSKYIYHLCLVSYYLEGKSIHTDFLRKIKRIKWQPVSDEYKQIAMSRLAFCKQFREVNNINVDEELGKLYKVII